jgi:hypothetical protein
MIWGEQFHWSRPVAILWLFLYIEEPVWMISLVSDARAQAAALPAGAGAALSPLLQLLLLLEAVVLLAASTRLLAPGRSPAWLWPWDADRVSARIMAGFTLGWATWAVTLAFAADWPAARGGVLLNLIWIGATLIAMALFRSAFDWGKTSTRLFAAVAALLFGALLALYAMAG